MFEQRAHPRSKARLPCWVRTTAGEFASFTVDLSLGGVGVELPPAVMMLRDDPITAVAVADLPALPVEVRWRSNSRFGARFLYPERARPFIADLLDRLADGIGPISPPNG